MKTLLCLAALLTLPLAINAQDRNLDHELAVRLVEILSDNYDDQPVSTAMESIIKQAGKKSYKKLLDDWLEHRSRLDQFTPTIEPAYNGLLRTLRKELPGQHAVFENHISRLSTLTLLNFQILFDAVQEYASGVPLHDLDNQEIDASLRQGTYPERQRDLLAQEEILKKEIWQIITHPEVAGKLGFYIFFFDQIAQTRQKTIDKMLESMVAKAD